MKVELLNFIILFASWFLNLMKETKSKKFRSFSQLVYCFITGSKIKIVDLPGSTSAFSIIINLGFQNNYLLLTKDVYLVIIECSTHNSIAKWNLKGHTGHQMQFLKVCVYKGMGISRASQFVSWICPLGFYFPIWKIE